LFIEAANDFLVLGTRADYHMGSGPSFEETIEPNMKFLPDKDERLLVE
jgi:hypothetical protein